MIGYSMGAQRDTPYEQAAQAQTNVSSTLNDGLSNAKKYTPLGVLFGFLILYFLWGVLQKSKFTENIQPSNLKANLHNILVMTIGVAIGFNIFRILFGKMKESSISGVSKCGTFLGHFFTYN